MLLFTKYCIPHAVFTHSLVFSQEWGTNLPSNQKSPLIMDHVSKDGNRFQLRRVTQTFLTCLGRNWSFSKFTLQVRITSKLFYWFALFVYRWHTPKQRYTDEKPMLRDLVRLSEISRCWCKQIWDSKKLLKECHYCYFLSMKGSFTCKLVDVQQI